MESPSMIYFLRQLEKTQSEPRGLPDDSAFAQLSELVNMGDPRGYEIRTA